MAAHLIGYVGEASEGSDARTRASRAVDIVGQSGVEKVYNKLLMGEDGAKRVVVNSVGREIRMLEEDAAGPGQPRPADRRLRPCRRRAKTAFRARGYNGSAVVLDPRRPARCWLLTSVPAFDPNDFATGINRATWAQLNTDKLRPLQNRAIQGRYSPGSTFKMSSPRRRLKRV